MSKGSDIVAGDQGAKPTVHISQKDAQIAEQQGRANKSMSTVKSEWAEESKKLDEIARKKRKLLEQDDYSIGQILNFLNEIPEPRKP